VDLPAPALSEYAEPSTPWRKAAIATAAIAAVELALLVVIVLAFVAKPFAADSQDGLARAEPAGEAAAAEGVAKASPPRAALPRSETTVLVLNGNGVPGAAAAAAKEVRRLDYPTPRVGDASRRDFLRTIVMYRDDFEGEAVRLARDLGLTASRAVPLDGMRANALQGAELVLVVGG
jgi:hypothetical protein